MGYNPDTFTWGPDIPAMPQGFATMPDGMPAWVGGGEAPMMGSIAYNPDTNAWSSMNGGLGAAYNPMTRSELTSSYNSISPEYRAILDAQGFSPEAYFMANGRAPLINSQADLNNVTNWWDAVKRTPSMNESGGWGQLMGDFMSSFGPFIAAPLMGAWGAAGAGLETGAMESWLTAAPETMAGLGAAETAVPAGWTAEAWNGLDKLKYFGQSALPEVAGTATAGSLAPYGQSMMTPLEMQQMSAAYPDWYNAATGVTDAGGYLSKTVGDFASNLFTNPFARSGPDGLPLPQAGAGAASSGWGGLKDVVSGGMSLYSGFDAMRRAKEMQKLAQGLSDRADPWGSSGGRSQAIQQLMELNRDPTAAMAKDPRYAAMLQAAQRGTAMYGQDSGNLAVAAAGAGGNWMTQRMAELSGLAGANTNPATSASMILQGELGANNLASQGLASIGYGVTRFGGNQMSPEVLQWLQRQGRA